MEKAKWNEIEELHISADLSIKGLTLGDFSEREVYRMKYEMALKLLEELGQ